MTHISLSSAVIVSNSTKQSLEVSQFDSVIAAFVALEDRGVIQTTDRYTKVESVCMGMDGVRRIMVDHQKQVWQFLAYGREFVLEYLRRPKLDFSENRFKELPQMQVVVEVYEKVQEKVIPIQLEKLVKVPVLDPLPV